MEITVHPIPPVFDKNSKILILGSFPSVKSREQNFFYGHPQNRFWHVLSILLESPLPQSVDEKKLLLLKNGIALWDVIASCKVKGSSDSSITDVVPNDLSVMFGSADINIRAIYTNGKTAKKYYDTFLKNTVGIDAVCLPSTSPANAAYSLEKLCDEWHSALIVNQN